MAATKRLTYAAICYGNLITTVASLVSASSQLVNYPASRLLSPLRSSRTRSADLSDMTYVFDLKVAAHPTMVGFIDPNFMNLWSRVLGTTVRLTLADNNLLTLNPVYWDIPCLAALTPNMVTTHYLDTPTSGTYVGGGSATVKRFAGLTIYANGAATAPWKYGAGLNFIELGGFFLGYYQEIPVDPSSNLDMKDDSPQTKVRSGSVYTDVMDPYCQGGIQIPQADLATEVWPLRTALAAGGNSGRIILDNAAMSSDAYRQAYDVFYGRVSGGSLFGQKIEQATRRTINFDFEEDNG